jgi:hypothetical protein
MPAAPKRQNPSTDKPRDHNPLKDKEMTLPPTIRLRLLEEVQLHYFTVFGR